MAKIEDNNKVDATYIRSLIERFRAGLHSGGFYGVGGGSIENWLMLVVSDIGDALDPCYDDALAISVIHLCEMCVEFGLNVRLDEEDMCDAEGFMETFGEDSFCERCYYLTRLLCLGDTSKLEDTQDDDCMPVVIGSAISFIFSMCACEGIDLKSVIEENMELWYN